MEIPFTEEGVILHLLGEPLGGGKSLQGGSDRDWKAALVPKYVDAFGPSVPF